MIDISNIKFIKKNKIFEWKTSNLWWKSHTMAPSAIFWKDRIRIFIGAWSKNIISRITYIDVDPYDPSKILKIKKDKPILDIGKDGFFDDNGVFPGHASIINKKIFLYYTGFQKGFKVPHYNFGGLALSDDGENFERYLNVPILDRKEEGTLVRAGQSVIYENGIYKSVYSAGGEFKYVGGKVRPTYNVYYQESDNPYSFKDYGIEIAKYDPEVEHGLGRPQIIKIADYYFTFYTRRMLNMKYFIGCSISKDCKNWIKKDSIFSEIKHSDNHFDSNMIYFPSVVYSPLSKKYFLIYCGNEFGKSGIGYCELINT